MRSETGRRNMYAGTCHYCKGSVPADGGWLFSDIDKNLRNAVRHEGCNDATPRIFDGPLKPSLSSAMAAMLSGDSSKAAKVPSLEEAAEAVIPHTDMADAQALELMLSGALTEAVEAIAKDVAAEWLVQVPPMVAELLAVHRKVEIRVNDLPAVILDQKHKSLDSVLVMIMAGVHPFLVGPAGSGKTTMASQLAKVLGRAFYMAARVTSEYKLTGFVDAQGNTVRTQFREAYEHGGVFLFDEVDASDPDAMTAFNAALANGYCDFPDGMVKMHPDFAAIAAGNTYGRGADRQYVGRNQLDAATLDRFAIFVVDYDEDLEFVLAGNDAWVKYVQAVRKSVAEQKVRHVVSPRASISGAKLLAAGMERDMVEDAVLWKGMADAEQVRVLTNMPKGVY